MTTDPDDEEDYDAPEEFDDEHEIDQWQKYYPEEFDDDDDS